jgi:hypothetical protein
MLLKVLGPDLDFNSVICEKIKAYGYTVRHYSFDNESGINSLYFDHSDYLMDVVCAGSKDVVRYEGFFEEIINLLKNEDGIKVYTVHNDEAGKEIAITDYDSDELLLRLELPGGTLYDDPQKIPVKLILQNKTYEVIEAKVNKTSLFEVRISDLDHNRLLSIEGEETDMNTFVIKPQDLLADEFTITIKDFKGNLFLVGLTQMFEFKGNPTLFQTAPLRVTIK